MYLVKFKEGTSPQKEVIVQSTQPTETESLVAANFNGDINISNMTKKNYVDIFESELGGYFYEIQIEYDSMEGDKVLKETFIQEAVDFESALTSFVNNVNYGEIISFKRTKVEEFIKIEQYE